ncbi:peptide chain release factor N(5)-glutamine methyltransferase [Candidatus Uhrbacteria bacterium]|nr:peptide chain release factor N(5)-glutamine methyltransferase [Candidatus Uhrbacteria bacterium]
MTILDALQWAEQKLKGSKENPKLDAQVLLASVLDKGTAYLFAHGEDPLPEEKFTKFQRLVERRGRFEPVAYLVGHKEFYKREFVVNPHVLIPRPDTEALVDVALGLLTPQSLVVDIGTGSGAIALTIAAETGRPAVAIDADPRALAVAKLNADALGLAKRVAFFEGNLLEPLLAESNGEPLGDHLVITANLPYIAQRQYDALEPNVKAYEPKTALVSGIDGLDHYDALFAQIAARRFALPKALDVVVEIDPSQKQTAPALVRSHLPGAHVEVVNDLAGRPRVVVVRC